ncbi:hypothetical protein Tco_1327064 [Tanacetum coccineum]
MLMAMRLLDLISLKWSATTATRGDILLGSVELKEIQTTRTRKAKEGLCLWKHLLPHLWCHVMALVDITGVIRQRNSLIMHSWLSYLTSRNMAFVSLKLHTSSTNEAFNTAHGVTAASTQVNAANFTNIDNLSDAVIYAFFASQPNRPLLPTGRTFTLVGNACHLTRIITTNKVPLRELIPLKVVAQESVVTNVYTRRPKVPKTTGSNSKPKIAKSMISNKMKPSTSLGSNTSVSPSSSFVDLRLSKLFYGIWTLDARST